MIHRPCRFCRAPLTETFADLGMSPLSNSFIPPDRARSMEPTYPLHAWVCSACRLVQLEEFESPAHIFSDYLYFSSYSESWLRHAEAYAEKMTQRFGLGAQSMVVEVASNDGYLLQYFQRRGTRVLGVEPAANVAAVGGGEGGAERGGVLRRGDGRAAAGCRAWGRPDGGQQRAGARAGPP